MAATPIRPEQNNRETGARKYPASEAKPAETDTHACMPTANPFGLTQPEGETNEKIHQSKGVNQRGQATPSPSTAKVAVAGHSKDAKAPKHGRQPGAYVKH